MIRVYLSRSRDALPSLPSLKISSPSILPPCYRIFDGLRQEDLTSLFNISRNHVVPQVVGGIRKKSPR